MVTDALVSCISSFFLVLNTQEILEELKGFEEQRNKDAWITMIRILSSLFTFLVENKKGETKQFCA